MPGVCYFVFMKAQDTDWIGEWFPIIESLGEDIPCLFGKVNTSSQTVQWIEFSHQKHDGIGAFRQILNQSGQPPGEVPVLKGSSKPGAPRQLLNILRFLSQSKLTRMPWRQYDASKLGKSSGIAWHVFSEQETQRLLEFAHAQKISLNSWLLWALDLSVKDVLLKSDSSSIWLVPVNMRGEASKSNIESNHASYLGVSIPFGASAPEVHAEVQKRFQRGDHWGAWWGAQIGRYIGRKGMVKIRQKWIDRRHNWVGTLTNMGSWPMANSVKTGTLNPYEAWLIVAPVTRHYPVGAGVMTWNGKLGIALQLHQALTSDFESTQKVFKLWLGRNAN